MSTGLLSTPVTWLVAGSALFKSQHRYDHAHRVVVDWFAELRSEMGPCPDRRTRPGRGNAAARAVPSGQLAARRKGVADPDSLTPERQVRAAVPDPVTLQFSSPCSCPE